jgi:arginase family enzyme
MKNPNTPDEIEARIARVKAGFEAAAQSADQAQARRERRIQDILHDDVPTFMELPHALKPADLQGLDAAVVGFGYEGITARTPWLSAPPSVSRPEPGSVYWRMGADFAPDAIRMYSLYYSVHHNRGWYPEIDRDVTLLDHLKLADYGNIAVVRENIDETIRRAQQKIGEIVAAGAVPLVLGGDHTTPIPCLRAILEPRDRPIGIISFDAHLDLSHTKECWASTQWAKAFETGKVDPKNLVLIGIRSNRSTYFESSVAEKLGIRYYTIDEVKQRGMADVVPEALEIVRDGTDGIYVSLDIDAMEPGLVPAQKAPEIWGLTVDELMPALQVFSREKVVGYDVCEMTPDYDINGMGAQFCARTVVEILGGMAIRKRDAKAGLKSK